MKIEEIGGYLHWELLTSYEADKEPVFSSGRVAFAALLRHHKIKLVYLPRYTCDAMLEPIEKLGVDFRFYDLCPNLMPHFELTCLDTSIAIVVNNYFGLMDSKLEDLPFFDRVIVDNSQALYSRLKGGLGAFNSYRKFLGVSDGAQAYTYEEELFSEGKRFESSSSMEYLIGRYELGSDFFYKTFVKEDLRHTYAENTSISFASEISFKLVDHASVKSKRRSNYKHLRHLLQSINELDLSITDEIPLCYPFLPKNEGGLLREYLRKNKIYTPSYWPNKRILPLAGSYEDFLVKNLICLPVDQRYGINEISRIADLIRTYE